MNFDYSLMKKYLISISLVIFIINFSNFSYAEMKVEDLDSRRVCRILGLDCKNSDYHSFIFQMSKFIQANEKRCYGFSITQNKKTKELTNTSYYIYLPDTIFVHNCSPIKNQVIGQCERRPGGPINTNNQDEECILLFFENKILNSGFIDQYNQSIQLSKKEENLESMKIAPLEIIELKLKELRSMLDEGLISQKQYDERSSKIIDEF